MITHIDGDGYVYDTAGVPWHKAPLPARFHRCKPWTTVRGFGQTSVFCACGADRFQGHWFDKNKRRRQSKDKP